MEKEASSWDKKVYDLEAKLMAKKEKIDAGVQDQIETLERNRALFKEKILSFKRTHGAAWGELRAGMDRALNDMKSAYESAKRKVG